MPVSRRALVTRNATANLLRGLSSSLVNLVLPLALIRLFSVQEFPVWVLIFSVSMYALYLDLGMVNTLSALVARAEASQNDGLATSYVASGMRLVTLAAAVILAAYLAIANGLNRLFPQIPESLVGSAKVSLLLLGIAQIIVLYSNVLVGYFIGRQRSQTPAKVISAGKLVVFASTIGTASTGYGMAPVALAYCASTGAYMLCLSWCYFRQSPSRSSSGSRAQTLRPLLALSGVLGVFSICMLFISGLDAAVVGRLAYRGLAGYGVAASVGALVTGLFGALLSPVLPEFSRMALQGRTDKLVAILISGSERLTELLLGLLGLTAVAGPVLLTVLAGSALGHSAYGLTVLLVGAAAVRTSVTPLSVAIVALKDRRSVLLVPALCETVVNAGLSVELCLHIGAAGVAVGTIAGALAGLAAMLLVVVPTCPELAGRRQEVLRRAWILPVTRLTPFVAASALVYFAIWPVWSRIIVVLAAGLLSLGAVVRAAVVRLRSDPSDVVGTVLRRLRVT